MSHKPKNETIKVEPAARRSPLVIAMQRRHGRGVRVMKDRRASRGGAKREDHTEGW